MGLGYTLYEELRFLGGNVLDRNLGTRHIPRFSWVPRIEAVLIRNDAIEHQGKRFHLRIDALAIESNKNSHLHLNIQNGLHSGSHAFLGERDFKTIDALLEMLREGRELDGRDRVRTAIHHFRLDNRKWHGLDGLAVNGIDDELRGKRTLLREMNYEHFGLRIRHRELV